MMIKIYKPLFALLIAVLFTSCFVLKKKYEDKKLQEDGILEAIAFEKEKTIDPNTGTVPSERLLAAYKYAEKLRNENKKTRGPVSDINWTERGPNNVGGRTRAILYDLNDATYKTVWAGSVGGGLWKTTDITATPVSWNKIDDFFDNLAISSIAQHPVNHDTMYFGTGEGFGNFDAIRGLGIWRTVDGGTTWTQLASTNNSSFFYNQKVIVNANGVIYAATQNGVQKSTNHGATWTKVLGSGVSGGTTNFITDIEFGADGDVYAGCSGSVFKSDNGTHGANTGNIGTWTNITPAGTYARTEIFTAPSDSTVLYALCNTGGVPLIFRSATSGSSWTTVTTPGFCDQGTLNSDFTRGQAWYDLIGIVAPNDPNTIYVGGVDALKSTDGGNTWSQITSWTGGANGSCTAPSVYVHADHHNFAFKPGSSTEFLLSTDGGIFRTTNAGSTFTQKNNGYNVTQYYGCAAHPTNPNYFLAGAQDNGTQKFNQPGINTTTQATGGDGAFCHIDQTNGNIQITSYVYANYYLSTNGGSSFGSIAGGSNSGRFINPTDYDNINDVLYGAHGNGVYELVANVGAGNNRSTRNISAVVNTRRVSAITVDPNTPSTVWMGFQSGSFSPMLVKVDNATAATPTVTNLSTGLPSSNGLYISAIDVEKGNSNHIILSFSNYGTNSVWESTNGGTSWNSIEGNLPDMPIRWCMIHPDSNTMAFVATDLGVWSTNQLNGASTDWAPTNNGFANVRVDMLQFRETDNTLVAATHGRGLFTATLPHVPKINFSTSALTVKETPTTTIGCRRFKDYTIDIMASYAPALPVTVDINVAGGATATEFADYEYTTNGSFVAPSHQAVFNNVTSSVPLTVRIYDDNTHEPVAETFTLNFSIVGNAVNGSVPTCTFTINDNSDNPLLKRVTMFVENFESGNNPPAGWTLVGTNSNRWGNKNYGGCQSTINNYTMQVYRFSTNTCGYNINSSSTAYVYRTINASGYTNLQASFDWICFGEDGYDYAELVYSTNTVTPSWTVVPGSTQYVNTVAVQNETVDLPIALNNTTFLLGWRWINDNNTGGPSMGFDNLIVSGESSRSIENTISNDNEYLGPNNDIYYYSSNGDIICRIENMSNHDYGCTQVNIDATGNSAKFITGETDLLKKIFDKTIMVTPTNNNASGQYVITLYVTNAEKTGFETEGRTWNTQGNIFKMPISINAANTGTPRDFATNLSKNSYLNGFMIKGEFYTGFSGFGVGDPGPETGIPLSLQLINFNGSWKDKNVVLNWITENEKGMTYIDIERSENGLDFEKTGTLNAYNKDRNNYKYIDNNTYKTKYYYRLKMNSEDGGYKYSNVLLLLKSGSNEIVIYPNPSDKEFTIFTSDACEIKLSDLAGATLKSMKVNGNAVIDMQNYASGVYILTEVLSGKTYKLIKK